MEPMYKPQPAINGKPQPKQRDPIQWTFKLQKTSFNTYQFRAIAKIEGPWRLYTNNSRQGSPPSTWIDFESNPVMYPLGGLKEQGSVREGYDPHSDITLEYYNTLADYVQDFQVTDTPTSVKGTIYYAPCTEGGCTQTLSKDFEIRT